MKTVPFGALAVGNVPRVVGTLSTLAALKQFSLERNRQCDIAEVRLDEIGAVENWLDLCKGIEASGTPVLLTLRSQQEGGKWNTPELETLALLRGALPHVSAMDVEFRNPGFEKVCRLACEHKKPLVASFHDFERTPAYSDLSKIVLQAGGQADVVKISTMIKEPSDVRILQDLLGHHDQVPLCVIGMGAEGTCTRTSFPAIGSCLTYGYLYAPNAPGQLPASALVSHLRSVHPRYNEEFIARHQLLEFV